MEAITPNSEDTKRAIETVIRAIGEDPTREGLKGTPDRILRMFKEIFRGYDSTQKPHITTFDNDENINDMVFDSGEYYSMCEHHFMPFYGAVGQRRRACQALHPRGRHRPLLNARPPRQRT